MENGYGQFCPIAKAAELFATRWTPLILRELLSGVTAFNDIHKGVPLMSRALLVERLRQLESEGLIERRTREQARGHDYILTQAGEDFRPLVAGLGKWGMAHGRSRITEKDLDPGLLMWAFHIRAGRSQMPERRIVVRFEFAGVPASRTKFKVMWLVLDRGGADVCAKDPGFETELVARGPIAVFVQVFVGNMTWTAATSAGISVEGDREMARQLPVWLRLDKQLGSDLPFVHHAA